MQTLNRRLPGVVTLVTLTLDRLLMIAASVAALYAAAWIALL